MNNLIPINYDNPERPTVSGRELHDFLNIETPYAKWFGRMVEYGFTEDEDYATVDKNVHRADGTQMPQIQHDHQLTIPMAKELCMIQRNERGKRARQYFLAVEAQWNSPEAVMRRAVLIATKQNKQLVNANRQLTARVTELEPKGVFADAVSASKSSILIGELAKIVRQNGVDMGQNRLFDYLRKNGYLVRGNRTDRNMPTQRSMELGLFEIKETTICHSDGHTSISKTVKVTGKGQQYFINLLLGKKNPDKEA